MDYGILSLVPPILACGLAFATKQVVVSLLIALFSGALILQNYNLLNAFTETCGTYITGSITSSGHAATIIFLLIMSGMIALVEESGGLQTIAKSLSGKIKNERAAQVITSLLGCLVFFDDYANILIVGPTASPISDRVGVSREKQTYIVHTTAGVVAGIAVFTTWIGFEMGLINDAFSAMGYQINAFTVVIKNIPYMMYNILAIVLLFAVAGMVRDFGPMYNAEKRARTTGQVLSENDHKTDYSLEAVQNTKESKLTYALLPILTFALVTFFGLWYSGYEFVGREIAFFSIDGFRESLANADPMPVCVWASMASLIVAVLISKLFLKDSFQHIYETWLKGFTDLCEVCIILVLAWGLGSVINDIGTADYIISLVGDKAPAEIFPAVIFIVSCLISFATGTSWGTMPIMFPIAIPLVSSLVENPTESTLVIATIAAVLSGCIFGDQTSPISDSSIVTSAAVGCNLIDHIKTEAPYELFPALLAVVGYLLIGFCSISVWIVLVITTILTIAFVRFIGKSTQRADLN